MREVISTDPETGGQKGVKEARYDLMPWDALDEVAKVYGHGCAKYEERNWERGYKWGWSIGALVRHVALFAMGEWTDRESGRPHLAHAAWHCLTLMAFFMRGKGTDDRSTTKPMFPGGGLAI